ncbi:hypothetical protein EG68_05586 [Paragonimus skrjabini miyazakii]|uniref:DUF5741 domain-containing protein n=1 Tax=Paragonimus skrjabini miyazakii TaxID=59628 RepID=A0A8S9YR67_9TREM|nr:hypothetical protein EG68_05586 [Paragonimus skrjabini miyazakii]
MNSQTPFSGGRNSFNSENRSDLFGQNEVSYGTSTKGAYKSTEETMAELRRENFRLRLICFDYERARKRLTDPQDAESSRLFSVEAENLNLKEAVAEKTSLLQSASKMIDTLKEENDLFRLQLKESKEKLDENERGWQDKYDRIYAELQNANETIRTAETRILAQEHETARQQNEWQSRLSELKVNMQSCEAELDRKHCEVLMLQTELDSLRAALGQVETQQPRLDESQIAIHDLSVNIHSSCQQRIQDVSAVVHALIKQITDVGLSPCIASLPEWLHSSSVAPVASPILRKPLSEIPVPSNQIETQSTQTDKGTGSDSSNPFYGDHNTDGTTASVYWLSERLNAARRLILELGNQKLKQDALIAQMQASHQDGLKTVKENCHATEEQLEKQEKVADLELGKREKGVKHSESAQHVSGHAASTSPLIADEPADIESLQRHLALVREQLNKQIDDYARLKKAYDILATTTHFGSLVSADNEDAITSISVSKSPAHVSADSSSLVGSMTADLPTVSTPPRLSGSLNNEDVTDLDELVVANKLIESVRNVSSPELSYTTLDIVEEAVHSPRDPATFAPVLRSGDKPCGLSTSGILHELDVQPALNLSLPDVLVDHRNPQTAHFNSPVAHEASTTGPAFAEPKSLSRLRDLYNLVHGLKLQLDNVRFTQHSFVEMVSRSLCTSGVDASLLFSPGKPCHALSEPITHEDVAVGTSCLFVSGVPRSEDSTLSEPNAAQLSRACATYGGVDTILDNLELSFHKSICRDEPPQKTSFTSATGLNKTVSELRAYPDSPAPRTSAMSKKPYYDGAFDKTGPHSPVSTFKSRHSIFRLKAANVTMTNSYSENIGRLTEDMLPTGSCQPLSVSFNLDEHSDSSRPILKPSLGDLTMVELQNKDLFERLARATAKLRDALDECAEAGSQLWTGDVSQCLSQLFTSQLEHEDADGAECSREVASHHSNESVQLPPPIDASERVTDSDDKTPEQRPLNLNFSLTGCNGTVGPNHSVRFDRLGPCLAPSDFAQLSADSSLSQLYGSMWRAPESSFSEKAENKISITTQTSTSKPTSTQLLSDQSVVVMLQRFVCLLTHALSVMHQSIGEPEQHTCAGDSEEATSLWLPSWVTSATNWFQSYLDALTCGDRSKCTNSVTQSASDKYDIESLLECLERVFNEHIDDWVSATKCRFASPDPRSTKEMHEQNSRLSTMVADLRRQLNQVAEEKDRFAMRCEELRVHLDNLLSVGFSEKTQSMPNVNQPPRTENILERFFSVGSCKLAAPIKYTSSVPIRKMLTSSQPSSTFSKTEIALQEYEAAVQLFRESDYAGFLNDSLPECITALLNDLKRFTEHVASLTSQMAQMVPSVDHESILKQVVSLKQHLSDHGDKIERFEKQRTYILQRLDFLNCDDQPEDLAGAFDLLLAELVATRETLDQFDTERSDLRTQLESCVPRSDYDGKVKHLEQLTVELYELRIRLDENQRSIDYVITALSSLAPSEVASSLSTLTDWLVSELTEQRCTVDQLLNEQQQVHSTLSGLLVSSSVPDSLMACVTSISQQVLNDRAELNNFRTDRDKLLALFAGFGFAAETDVLAYANALISALVEKQEALSEFEGFEDQVQETLRNSVPLADHEHVKCELMRICEDLTHTKTRVSDLEAELETVLQNSVSLDEYQRLHQQLGEYEERLTTSQENCNNLQSELRQLATVIPVDVAKGSLFEQVDTVCKELAERRQTVRRLEEQYEDVLTDCTALKQQVTQGLANLDDQSARIRAECDAQVAAYRDQMEVKLNLCVSECDDMRTELEQYRARHHQLTEQLASREAEASQLLEQLTGMEGTMQSLHSTIVAKTQSAQAAEEAAAAHEARASELAIQLERLRSEHALCPPTISGNCQSRLVDAQISPIGKCRSAEELVTGDQLPESTDMDLHSSSRLHKYSELKAVAFEIKEKLIQRTDKLEAALTEVARLRSVIRQDKEHASHILEEVQDLRKQAIRKNRRIHELESELNRIKSSAAKVDINPPVSSARNTRSSTRTASEVEQPRGAAPRRFNLSHFGHSLDGSVAPSLLAHPDTPSINSAEFERVSGVAVDPNSTSLLFASPDQVPSRGETTSRLTLGPTEPVTQSDEPVEAISTVACKRCEALHNLVISLRTMVTELQRRVHHDLNQEHSLLVTLDTLERQSDPTDNIPVPASSKSCSTANPETSVQASLLSFLGSSTGDLKINIKTLQHARSRLTHYADEMDRICSNLARRLTSSDQHPAYQRMINLDELKHTLRLSVRSLCRVRRRLKTFFFDHMQPVDNTVFNQAIAELKTVIRMLTVDLDLSCLELQPNSEDKENAPPVIETPLPVNGKSSGADLTRQAQRHRQCFLNLARGLDSMTKELTQTTDVLVATRANLEQQTGLSGFRPSTN